ncbi:hypothetical protein AQUCO_00700354v1 [Aquilegia coerulea]|uniref:Uncharacterized protein n=1 Tax=Aquilegia coerulea TaxID=218851 RepID=A0A2G5EJN4_AQUCA|nr:hypothetical protein AQUCO_00700354v1 [Aquilegia coerulea]
MGQSASKRVENSLHGSSEFRTACESVYKEALDLAQHIFPGIRPYQLFNACTKLHQTLSTVDPLIKKWVPSPPSQSQVDSALSTVIQRSKSSDFETLNYTKFEAFAVELYKCAVVGNAGKALLQRVPFGIAGIAGIGMVTRSGKELVGSVMGVYALGVATAVYLSLSG